MYDRTVKGRTLNLGVSGLLWENNLVMVDRQTGTLWSQILGRGMRGPLKNARLELIPCVMTDWETWKASHPGTSAVMMKRSSDFYTRDFNYEDSGLILGIAKGGKSRAWMFSNLYTQPIVNDRFDDKPVLIVFDKRSSTALLYQRIVDERELVFENKLGILTDRETGSEWDMLTGSASAGPLAGKRLQLLPAVVSDHATWDLYHPNGTLALYRADVAEKP